MPFAQRQHYRFPLFSPVRYETGTHAGSGAVTNISSAGWRVFGTLPLQAGDVCSMKVRLTAGTWVSVALASVRWVIGNEYGIETLAMNEESTERLTAFIEARIKAL